MDSLPAYSVTEPDVLAFVLIPLALVAALTWATDVAWRRAGCSPTETRRAIFIVLAAATAWMTLTHVMADRGVLRDWDGRPPAFILLAAAIFTLAAAIAFSRLGARLARHIPLWMLVAVQAFRFPLEVAMHRMAERGIMPDQMSYGGRNFDIVTGFTAFVVALVIRSGRGGRSLALAWNVVGLALLVNIVSIAILSTPRFAWFGPDRLNVWVTYPPFVWLPAVMVLSALAGHLIVFRAILQRPAAGRASRTG